MKVLNTSLTLLLAALLLATNAVVHSFTHHSRTPTFGPSRTTRGSHVDTAHKALADTYWSARASDYETSFFDDFNGDELNDAFWNRKIGFPPDPVEKQIYSDSDKNIFVRDGNLHIKAIREDVEYQGGKREWSSGRINTAQKFNFSNASGGVRMSTKVKCKPVNGPFSAVWALSEYSNSTVHPDSKHVEWPLCGEIDFFEMQTLWDYTPSTLHFGEHFGDKALSYFSYEAFKTVDDWHEYGVEWSGGNVPYLAFYHDGKRIGEYPLPATVTQETWPYTWNNPFYLIINNAMNPSWAPKENQAGADLTEHDLLVDWIKVEEMKKK